MHNKKRNTKFLFEALLREATERFFNKEDVEPIRQIVKEFFNSSSILNKELEIFNSLLETTNLRKDNAEKFLFLSKQEYNDLDSDQIFEAQTKLQKEIKEKVGDHIYDHFIPDYKNIATACIVLNKIGKLNKRLQLENKLVDKLMILEEKKKDELKPLTEIEFENLLKEFNEKYNKYLLPEQKEIIRLYMLAHDSYGLDLATHLNEELNRLKMEFSKVEKYDTGPILEKLSEFSKSKFAKEELQKVLKMQKLLREMSYSGPTPSNEEVLMYARHLLDKHNITVLDMENPKESAEGGPGSLEVWFSYKDSNGEKKMNSVVVWYVSKEDYGYGDTSMEPLNPEAKELGLRLYGEW